MCKFRECGAYLPECTNKKDCVYSSAGSYNRICRNEDAQEPEYFYEIWSDYGGAGYYEYCEHSVIAENPQSASEKFLSNWNKNPNGNLNPNIYSTVVVEANKDPNDYANQLLVIRNY